MRCDDILRLAADIYATTEMRLRRHWSFREGRRVAAVRAILRQVETAAFNGDKSIGWMRRRLAAAAGAMVRH